MKVELPPPGAACGNGRLEIGEECDDGNASDCDGCSARLPRSRPAAATASRCGAEQCDDGNADDCDGCSATCQVETGLLCGDGIVNAACGEECEPPVPGGAAAECTRVAGCGDGIVEPGEECDDGNTDDCDGCTSTCTLDGGLRRRRRLRRRGVRRRQHDELRRLLGDVRDGGAAPSAATAS